MAAPCLIAGVANAEVFTACLRHVLWSELKQGDIVILGKLSPHKIPSVTELLSAHGATVRDLPADSPDLNPIEMAGAKLKAPLRQAAARSLADLPLAVASSLSTFTPAHGQTFFRHAQYASI